MKKQLLFVAIFCAVFGLCDAGCECPANCENKDAKKVEEVTVAPKVEENKTAEENNAAEEKTINEEEFAKFSRSLKDEEKPADVKEAAAPVADESKKA